MRIIVVGSVAAGISAAQMIAAQSPAEITVYERGRFLSCGQYGLPYYLANPQESLGDAIRSKTDQMRALGIEVHLRHEVEHIDAARHEITVRDLDAGQLLTDRYDHLVLATGAETPLPQVPGSEKMGVHTLDTVGDVLFLREFLKSPYIRDIVILGGGVMGLELAKAMLTRGRNVRIVDRERRLLPLFDEPVAQLIRQKLEAQGVQFSLGESVTSFEGRTYVETLRCGGSSYPCDLCLCTSGVRPRTGLLAGTGATLDAEGFARIKPSFETDVPGLYAAGSCARVTEGKLRTFSLHLDGLEIARTGLTEEEAHSAHHAVASVTFSGVDRPGICPNPREVTLKLVYDPGTRRLLGAQGWGAKNVASRINALAVAIAAGMTCAQLAEVDFVFSAADGALWDPIQLACRMAKP
ncbi:MAG: FAD-dependent oxidoreductase [Candidatus Limiplasma sp.]|nr:FAD-dependent oxidoreductase [Candidatus Limiplasma sp.]